MKFSILFLLIILFCSVAKATEFKFLKEPLIYTEPMANPRTPSMGISINTSHYLGQRVGYINGSLGKNFPLIAMINEDFKLQLGIEAGTWITLGYDAGTFPLITQDFLFAFPISFRHKGFSGAFKFNHISAHLGDGYDRLLKKSLSNFEKEKLDEKERLLDEDGLSIRLTDPKVYSRDFVSIHGAYEYNFGELYIKHHAQLGYAHKIIPENLGRWFIGGGIETKYKTNYFSPYYYQDITWNEDVDCVDYSGQLGGYIKESSDNLFNIRIAITGYYGSDRRGQMFGRKLSEIGIGFFIQ